MVAPATKEDRDRGILSEADRSYLRADEEEREENYTRQARSKREDEIFNRTHHALRDFQLLLEHLPADQREQLFSLGPKRNRDVIDALTFLYAGVGGAQRFKPLLLEAVAEGECELGNAYSPMLVVVSEFDVRIHDGEDLGLLAGDALEKLKDGKPVDALSKDELFAFAHFADRKDAIDIETVREYLEDIEHKDGLDGALKELADNLGE